jgi:hypothetical protein
MFLMQSPKSFGRAIYKRQGDDFARQRSRYLDIFSEVELRLSQLYLKHGLKNTENSVGQKIGELTSLKPNPKLSKMNVAKIKNVCANLSGQVKIRNGLVHSTMSFGKRTDEDVAFFQKISDAANSNPIYFVMSFDDFKAAIDALEFITSSLEELLNQPLIQNPPSP